MVVLERCHYVILLIDREARLLISSQLSTSLNKCNHVRALLLRGKVFNAIVHFSRCQATLIRDLLEVKRHRLVESCLPWLSHMTRLHGSAESLR